MPKSRFFRVAVEGATTDGRNIDRKAIMEMAATYNRATYGARVNLEHIRGYTAEPPFNAYGDVLALKTEEIQLELGGKAQTRLALLAQIDALDGLVAMNRARQKLYTSVEIQPDFAGTGKAYLMGLAVTDSPASLGTEMLEFCQGQGDNSPLAARKLDPTNMFSAAIEMDLAFDDADADPATGLVATLRGLIDKLSNLISPAASDDIAADEAADDAGEGDAPTDADLDAAAAAAPAQVDMTTLSSLVAALGDVTTALSAAQDDRAALRTELDALKAAIEETPATHFKQRPLADGGEGQARTDC